MFKTTIVLLIFSMTLAAQTPEDVFSKYDQYKESSISNRRFKHQDIEKLIKKFENTGKFKVKEEGKSILGKSIYSLEIGTGPVHILLWSQMHGDEATATMALMDLFHFFVADDEFNPIREQILSNATLYFIPMLNPDGAEIFTRRNALGVDLNRDALRLQSPEARILKNKRDETQADFGFNLHDQGRVYSVGYSPKQATISFLAPAFNYEQEINEVRASAMQVIGQLDRVLQNYIPGHVAKYSDEFEPRAFGDNITKWGTSLILIESGGYPQDRDKQFIRRMNFLSILSSFVFITNESYKRETLKGYEQLPFNDRLFFDLLITGMKINKGGIDYTIDLAVNQDEVDYNSHKDYYLQGKVEEVGDLSIFYGYETFDASGYQALPGKVYPKVLTAKKLATLDQLQLLKEGYLFLKVKGEMKAEEKPILNILSAKGEAPAMNFRIGNAANFVLSKEGKVEYVVINGFLVDLDSYEGGVYGGVFIK
ncbi:MAG: M14 family zinc carboxypeptidase [Cyclobacteriaceae bacterium]|nr:M14 family zinc carboxypeptidase [Cyclobacteriaceae bacterium]